MSMQSSEPTPAGEPSRPTQPPGGPRVTRAEVTDLGRVRRPSDRQIGGVAAGIARHLDIDPVLVRVGFVVLAFFAGIGVLLYAALWLVLPDEGKQEGVAGFSESARAIVIVLILALAAVMVLGIGDWSYGASPVALVLFVLVAGFAVVLSRSSSPAPPPEGLPDYRPGAPGGAEGTRGVGTVEPDPAGPVLDDGPPPEPEADPLPDEELTMPLSQHEDVTPTARLEDPAARREPDDRTAVYTQVLNEPGSTPEPPPAPAPAAAAAPAPAYSYQPRPPVTRPPAPPMLVLPPRPPDPRRRGRLLLGPTIALVLLASGLLAAVDVSGADVPLSAYPALATALIGGALLLAAVWGRGGGLIALGLMAALSATMITAVEQVQDTTVTYRPTSVEQLRANYGRPIGDVVLDLRELDPDDLTRRQARNLPNMQVSAGLGDITVLLPPDVPVGVDCTVAWGSIDAFGEDFEGGDLRLTQTPDTGEPSLWLQIDLGAGDLVVQQP